MAPKKCPTEQNPIKCATEQKFTECTTKPASVPSPFLSSQNVQNSVDKVNTQCHNLLQNFRILTNLVLNDSSHLVKEIKPKLIRTGNFPASYGFALLWPRDVLCCTLS
ncbi:unnamed protein product [Meloidogyne enterolobii]|uniref:Uncharacterized protein n=2 Tax=Meloidogyne enterolobii TaxID=390850 RepID=A0ACB0YSJ4_MELEN|nr:unnamed protein product [Meloidogyne enterolobii]